MQAALDGELDAANMIAFERQRAQDPALQAEYDRQIALRAALRRALPKFSAPDSLRGRLTALADAEWTRQDAAAPANRRPVPARFDRASLAHPLFAHAATAILAAGLAASLTWFSIAPGPEPVASSIVAAHMRSLIASTPVDVVSSNRHTVKPWFDSHLALSPSVVDLSQAGYELVGGRADIVANAAVPTLVYRAREHLISVTALPSARIALPEQTTAMGGYRLVSWREDGFTYFAASDLPPGELAGFVASFRQAGAEDLKTPK